LIDTICFRIDLCDGQESVISKRLTILETIEGSTGETISNFCRGSLAGSWDSRISCSIHDKEWVWVKIDDHPKGGRTIQMSCKPWLRVEFSLQKWLYGINCFSYETFVATEAIYHFASFLQETLCVRFPDPATWEILRLDIGHVVKFLDNETMLLYLESMKRVEYPRRKMRSVVYQSSVMWVGSGTTLKLYGKQSEFKAHDRNRINKFFINKDISNMLLEKLDGVLRIELSIRKVALKSIGIERVFDLDYVEFNKIWAMNMQRIGIDENNVSRVWTSGEARATLSHYIELIPTEKRTVSKDTAYAVWCDIITNGRAAARRNVGDKKFYRCTKIFKDCGLSTASTLRQDEKPQSPIAFEPWHDVSIIGLLTSHLDTLPYHHVFYH